MRVFCSGARGLCFDVAIPIDRAEAEARAQGRGVGIDGEIAVLLDDDLGALDGLREARRNLL